MRVCVSLGIGLVVLFSSGCGDSVTKAQYDRLQLGMTAVDIEGILGKGKDIDFAEVERLMNASLAEAQAGAKIDVDYGDLRGVRWGNDKKNITVIFDQHNRLYRRFQNGL